MKLKIGEFSKMNNVSIQTLRYYDKVGLLKPSFVDSETGYRYYDVGQCVILDTIVFLRSLGYSLQEVHYYLSQTGKTIQNIIEERQEALIKERNKIDEQLFLMNQYSDSFHAFEENKTFFEFGIEAFPKRYIFVDTIEGSIYDMDDFEYELCLRSFKKHITTSSLDTMYFNRVGTIVNKEEYLNRDYYSNQMFVFVPKHQSNSVIKAGEFAVMYVYEFEGEKQQLDIFYDSIHSNGYEPIGNYYCEVVMEKPYLYQEQRSMFIRMQVPVKKKES